MEWVINRRKHPPVQSAAKSTHAVQVTNLTQEEKKLKSPPRHLNTNRLVKTFREARKRHLIRFSIPEKSLRKNIEIKLDSYKARRKNSGIDKASQISTSLLPSISVQSQDRLRINQTINQSWYSLMRTYKRKQRSRGSSKQTKPTKETEVIWTHRKKSEICLNFSISTLKSDLQQR